ncbi:MAG: FkbM family methyltransferase [Drouetiella hepatica Uher 2000/2452]|uniref:FkbM family methyltransferase n=1 Tax=Drouetiella hepatica Uher 2000/2452 TaxID=904376 RepID=A0A951QBR5_9CYAN|nr:FkbM family methyltransferase [Drouetiella hepatica Uher 2000/2452]
MSIFLHSLKKRGHLDRIHLTVCNVGSRKINDKDDYGSLDWSIFAPNLTIYGFDADADACEAANDRSTAQQVPWTEHHIPLALSNAIGEATLYVTQNPMCSSLYPPNEEYLERFTGLIKLVATDFTIEVETTTLDAFCRQEGIEAIDFLQIDVQGADLNVLQGANQILQTVLATQVEVEFSHLYKGQPLFADVDAFMRTNDFTLFDLSHTACGRARSLLQTSRHPGQLLWGDAYYFCDLIGSDLSSEAKMRRKTPEQILKLACLADVLEFSDYALELLEYLILNYGSDPAYNVADAIVESLQLYPDVANRWDAFPFFQTLRKYASPDILDTLAQCSEALP